MCFSRETQSRKCRSNRGLPAQLDNAFQPRAAANEWQCIDATKSRFESEQKPEQNQGSNNTTPAPVLGLRTVTYCTENEGTPNCGEAVNALKRAIYTGGVSPAQAKRTEEMQAVADALSLLANIIMAWNTTQMQAVLDRWANWRQVIPAELTGKIAPTRLQGINLRGVFRFPVERYASEILPPQAEAKTGTND